MTREATYQEILQTPLVDTESATTIGEFYLGFLPQIGLDEESGFSTYRPYGNSGWSEIIFDSLDEAGFLNEGDDWDEAEAVINKALKELAASYSVKKED